MHVDALLGVYFSVDVVLLWSALFFVIFRYFRTPNSDYFSSTTLDTYVFSRLGVFIDPNPNLEF